MLVSSNINGLTSPSSTGYFRILGPGTIAKIHPSADRWGKEEPAILSALVVNRQSCGCPEPALAVAWPKGDDPLLSRVSQVEVSVPASTVMPASLHLPVHGGAGGAREDVVGAKLLGDPALHCGGASSLDVIGERQI